MLCLASCFSQSLFVGIEPEGGGKSFLTKLNAFVESINCKLSGGIGAHAWMDDAAGCGGHCNDSPHAAKVLDEIVDHKMGSLYVCFLRID